ncbi:O-antigen ligase family protein [Candidatus Peregrinibacteria bacterium]|nr:O-antigen ligase family protein [Candidatus Peregrinibacteria bacterium]
MPQKFKTDFPSLFYLTVFLAPLVFNPFGGASPYEMAKQSFLFLVIGVFLLLVIVKLWHAKETLLFFNKTVFLIFGLWIFSFALSTIFSFAPIESFWGTYERLQGFLTNAYYGIHFLICLQLFRDEKFTRRFFAVAILVGVFVSVYAVMQEFFVNPTRLAVEGIFAGRPYSTIGSPTGLGQFLIFPFFVSLFYGIFEWRLACRQAGKNRMQELLFFGVAILIAITLGFSENRASILGISVAIILFIFSVLKSNIKKWIFAAAILLALSGFFVFFSSDLRSLGTRSVLWKSSSALISQEFSNPKKFLLGFGPEIYYHAIQKTLSPDIYSYERMTDIPDRSHNALLDALIMRGSFGFLLAALNIVFLIYLFIKRKIKMQNAKIAFFILVAYTISAQFSFSLTSQIVFLLGAWAIILPAVFKFRQIKIGLKFSAKVLISIFLIALALFSLWNSKRLFQTDSLFNKAISAYFVSEEIGLEAFDKVIKTSPFYAYPHRTVFILFDDYLRENSAVLPRMKFYADKLGEITNKSFHYNLAMAKIADAKGDRTQENFYFNRAVEQAPSWAILWMEWGELLFKEKDYKGAIEKFERLIKLSAVDKEKYRTFRISNQRFFEALQMLIESYEKLGLKFKADKIRGYL